MFLNKCESTEPVAAVLQLNVLSKCGIPHTYAAKFDNLDNFQEQLIKAAAELFKMSEHRLHQGIYTANDQEHFAIECNQAYDHAFKQVTEDFKDVQLDKPEVSHIDDSEFVVTELTKVEEPGILEPKVEDPSVPESPVDGIESKVPESQPKQRRRKAPKEQEPETPTPEV